MNPSIMIDFRVINQAQFVSAKRLWGAAIGAKLLIFSLGVWAVFIGPPVTYLPQIILALLVLSEILQLRSDDKKSRAEGLLRTLDVCSLFSHEISIADKRDIVCNVPRNLRKRFEGKNMQDLYFSNSHQEGPQRAVENLLESAWYTRHQAGLMVGLYISLIIGLLALSILTLIFALREIDSNELKDQVVKVVTACLLLIVSLNMFKAAWSYFKMYQRCQKTENICEHLLRDDVTMADAQKQWYEYQLTRATSPLLPQWLWKIRGSSLDDAWHRACGKNG